MQRWILCGIVTFIVIGVYCSNMGKTVYLSDDEEELIIKAIRTQKMMEEDGNDEKEAEKYGELWDKIARTKSR